MNTIGVIVLVCVGLFLLISVQLGWVTQARIDFKAKLQLAMRGVLFVKMEFTHWQTVHAFANAFGPLRQQDWGDANKAMFGAAETISVIDFPESAECVQRAQEYNL